MAEPQPTPASWTSARISAAVRLFQSRPALFLAALTGLGALAAMVVGIITASTLPFGSFRLWVEVASSGFRLEVELCLAGSVLLFMVDDAAAEEFPRRRLVFGALAVLGRVGVLANVAGLIAVVSVSSTASPAATSPALAKFAVALGFLASALVAGTATWLAMGAAAGVAGPRRVVP